jgi:hypothetical protein
MESPKERTEILPEKARARNKHTKMKAAGRNSDSIFTPEKPPTEKALYDAKTSVSKMLKNEIPAPKRDVSAIPARIIVVLPPPIARESTIIKIEVTSAPTKAPMGSRCEKDGKNERQITAARPAP